MTKVIILGNEPEKKKRKPIEFVKTLSNDGTISDATRMPKSWKNIEVILLNPVKGFDMFFAYDDGYRNWGCLYLGHYNDGIVDWGCLYLGDGIVE